MTDVGESIAVGMVKEAKGECFFCKEEPKSKEPKNDEVANPDTSDAESEDNVPENDEHNDASKLGSNIGGKPQWTVDKPGAEGEKTTVLAAAHHLIPGNASYGKVQDLLDFLRKGGPFSLKSDVGYGINHANNGVWLAGNYYIRSNNGFKGNWKGQTPVFQNAYARAAIIASKSQFHDAHSTYNRNVRKTLQKIADKIGEPEKNCPFCGEKYDKVRPPFGLVGRLDFVSGQHKRMLTSLTKKASRKVSFIRKGYFTSSRVKSFFGI